MPDSLKNRIVRGFTGRIFLVEKDPGTPNGVVDLRRLDREPREQARIFRPREEVLDWEILDPQVVLQPFKDTIRDFLRALEAWPKPDPEAEYLVPGSNLHLNRLAQLVED